LRAAQLIAGKRLVFTSVQPWDESSNLHAIYSSPITAEAIARIGALYGIEEEIRGKPSGVRRSVR
jgi:hypothetical protein